MSTLEVLKTKTGIKNFTLRNGDEDEIAMAFEYLDRKSEVHSLKVLELLPLLQLVLEKTSFEIRD